MQSKKIIPPPMKKLVLFKLRLKALSQKTKRLALDLLTALLVVSSLGYFSARAPEFHGLYLRHSVGSKVYMIKGKLNGGGGTGFAIKAPSGINYIVTNSHVCESALNQSENKTSLLVVNDDGDAMLRRIVEISDFTDLCLLEGLPGVEGLSVGDEPGLGATSYIVGHPLLRPLSISKGEIVGRQDVDILAYVLPGNPFIDPRQVKDLKCDLPKNRLVEITDSPVGSISACFNITKASYMSTIIIYPGNSGSPMVSWTGAVQGVAFAGDETNWAYVVSNKDLRKFLKRY